MAKSHSYKANVWIYISKSKRFTQIFVIKKRYRNSYAAYIQCSKLSESACGLSIRPR